MALPSIKPLILKHELEISENNSDLIIVLLDEKHIQSENLCLPSLQTLDNQLGKMISTLCSFQDFQGKWLQSTSTVSRTPQFAKRIALIGAGKKADFKPARARQLGIKIAEVSLALKANRIAVIPASDLLSTPELIKQCAVGVGLGTYKYPNSNLSPEAKKEAETPFEATFIHNNKDILNQLSVSETLQEAINLCRLLQDGAPNIVTPQYVSNHFSKQAEKYGITTKIFGAEQLKKMGFGAMLAVSGGSAQEPQFVVAEYKPKQYQKTLAFVGKGLTMDTGGYSLKTPSTFQEGMKYDMSGAAVALSSLIAIAKLQLPIHVYSVAALCENMVDANSYRVGDIITTYSGKTIEVIDTDAEGRIVLSDALYYTANDLKPDYIVEYSTLTGAMIIALGHVAAGVFSTDKKLEETVMTASEQSGERALALPVWEEVAEEMKGTMSDLCNIGSTRRAAGSMAAAAFLNEFVKDVPYAHIDIAGVADGNKAIGHPKQKGSSGYGIQLSVEIAKALSL